MSRQSRLPFAALATLVVATGLYGTVAAVGQPAPPPLAAVQSAGPLRLEGQVREVFGDKVIVEGATGRVLVETGPEGRLRAALAPGDKVVIDGIQRDGFVHAMGVTKDGGTRVALGPVPGPEGGPGGRMGPGERGGPLDRFGPPRDAGFGYRQDVVMDAVAKAGFRDARVIDVKKRHAEVAATGSDGRSYELHVEFDGQIRRQEDTTLVRDEGAIRSVVEKAGYTSVAQMRPEKKHMVVTATNSRGEKVELDVHRDGTIRKERRVF